MNIKSAHQGTEGGRETGNSSVCKDRSGFDTTQNLLPESALVSDKSALGDCCSLDCLAVEGRDVSGIV